MNIDSIKSTKPSPSEWCNQNPGKTLNDYYKIFGSNLNHSEVQVNVKYNSIKLTTEPEGYGNKRSSAKVYLLIFAIIILIAFISNPDIDKHKSSLKIRLSGIVESIASESDNLLVVGLGKMVGDAAIEELLKNVSVDNYLVFSVTRLNWATESKIVGYGIFGNVFISKELNTDNVKKTIDKHVNERKSR